MADATITVGGDVTPLRQVLRQGLEDLKRFGKEGPAALAGMKAAPILAVAAGFTAVAQAAQTVIGTFQRAVQASAQATEGAVDLGNALGISATQAAQLRAALAEEGLDTSQFMSAAQKLAANVRENESALNDMGLATRTAAGNLRPLNDMTLDAIKLVGDYKAGTDRAIAASQLFGKGFEISGDLAKVSNETLATVIERQERLGNVLSQENVAAFEAYDAAMKEATGSAEAMWQVLGAQLVPVATDFSNWASAIAPVALTGLKGALGGIVATFHLLTTGITVVWETANAMVVSLAESVMGVSRALTALMMGDFSGAVQHMQSAGGNISSAWSQAFDEMATKAQSTRDRIWNLFAYGTPTEPPAATDGRSANNLIKPEKKEEPKSNMSAYEAELSAMRVAASEENALLEFKKTQELAYWQTVLARQNVTAKDRVEIEKRVANLIVDTRRQEAQSALAVKREETAGQQALALARLDTAKATTQAALDAEQITKVQALEAERAFEAARYAIQYQATMDRIQLALLDPNTSPEERLRLQNDLEQLEQDHVTKMIGLSGQIGKATREAAEESGKIWDSLASTMSSLWDQGVAAMMNGTLTWRNAFRAIGMEMTRWFATQVVGKMVSEFIAGEARKLAAKLGFGQAEVAQQVATSTGVVAAKTTEAVGVGTANAVSAGSGAASAMSGVPYVGPVLALAAMAAVFAAVMGTVGKVKSAAGGFDIPAGLNPLTQLHEEEMVLPARYANTIRDLAAQRGEGVSSDPANVVNVYHSSSRWTQRDADDHAKMIAKSLNKLVGGGWRPA
ncbi:MAG: hypothetical protein REI09_05215 [Candidatus Dactylopiibacterium sp.]|nr:hypothetical protein [Candidatus Dactylopiibacterium sp.]